MIGRVTEGLAPGRGGAALVAFALGTLVAPLAAMVSGRILDEKGDLLQYANRKVNSTRYLLRLAKDLKLMSIDSYGFSAEKLDEIGRMFGGWRKAMPRTS